MKRTTNWVFVLLILLAQMPFNAAAQNPPQNNGEITQRTGNGLAKRFLFNSTPTKITNEVAGRVFLMQKLNLTEPYGLSLLNQSADKIGMIHYRYSLTYNNYPVENTMYILHTKQGVPVSANGDYVNDISLKTGTEIAEDKAIKTAYESENVAYTENVKNWINDNLKQTAEKKIIYHTATQSYKLVYEIKVVAGIGHQHNVAIDALNGDVLRTEDAFRCAKIHTVHSGEQQVTSLDSAGKFYLADKVRGIYTYDAKGAVSQGQEPTGAVLVENPTDEWQQANFSTGALDAHFASTAAYDYYLDAHNHKSYDGKGSPINSYVNVDIGSQPNAFWGGFMVISKPINGTLLATLDIVGHEISHGVSTSSAGFTNQGETGALGEAYSDMFGCLIEKKMFPNYPDSLNYRTGEQFVGLGRDFINPERFDNPRYYKGKKWDANNQSGHKNGNVHTHWFYLIAEGNANYINEKNETYNIKGIGRDKAGDIIFRALTVYLTSKSDYKESMLYTIQAAKDLYGQCSEEVNTLKTAWKAIGLAVNNEAVANAEFSVSSSRCVSPVQYKFVNTKGSNKTYSWDFGDGSTSTQSSPVKTYAASGDYKVTLNVVGCLNDNNTYTSTVIVRNGVSCDSTIMPQNNSKSTESCLGIFTSARDNSGRYIANNSSEVTFSNTSNSPYTIEFLSFDMGFYTDRLEVYEGVGTGGKKLGEYSFINPPTGVLTTTIGAITFKETTDGFSDYDGNGYEIYYECSKKSNSNSVQNIAKDNLKIWPNPTAGTLNIFNTNNIKTYSITNLSGRQIQQAQPNVSAQKVVVDLSSFANGIYLITIETDNGIYTEKVIVQHN